MTAATVSPALDVSHCAFCAGQLANFAGPLQDAEGDYLDQERRKVKLKPDEAPPRCYWIACGLCQTPVGRDHPWQVDLDRQVAQRQAQEREQAERAKKTPPASHGTVGLAYGDSAAQAVSEYVSLRAEVTALREEVAVLKQQLTRKR